jgi:type I restriction enzyme S subunit
MDAQQFLAEFGHIANAPGGIARLRELVYQFAVTGRLTTQREEDGDTDVVLNSIARTRQHLIDEKKFKRSPKLESAPLAPPAISIPPSWRWSRLLDLGEINPRNQVEEDAETVVMATFVPMAAVSELHSIRIAGEVRPWSEISKGYTHFANGDVLLAKITPCFENGKSAVVQGLEYNIGSGSTEFHVFRPISEDVNPAYVYLFVRSPLFRAKGEASMTGTAGQKRLPTDYFALCAMPLPPTEEQSRIVAKVDELMALCDQLEAQQQKRRTLQNHLRQATLQAVAASQSPHELQESWQRLQANFGQLFSAPGDLKELRNLILQLGIQGLLVDQLKMDQSSSEAFLSSLQEKRERLIFHGIVRRSAALPDIDENEKPFPLPKGWKFCRLGEASICRDGQRIPLSKAEREPRRGAYPYYGASGIIDHIDDYIFEDNLLLVGEDGANLINRSTPIAFIATGQYWVNNHAHVLDSVDDTSLRYLEVYINAIDLKPYVTGTAQPKMNQAKMNSIVIAIPPLEEQARIIERVDSLMSVCDELESNLRKGSEISTLFTISAVSALTGIAIQQEEEPMKAPQTELVAPVRLGTPPDVKAQAPLATILARHNGEMSAKDLWQRFGGEIDAFYAQLKTEVAHGWLLEPAPAEMREKATS